MIKKFYHFLYAVLWAVFKPLLLLAVILTAMIDLVLCLWYGENTTVLLRRMAKALTLVLVLPVNGPLQITLMRKREGRIKMTTIVLNFSHPIHERAEKKLAEMFQTSHLQMVNCSMRIDRTKPILPQISTLAWRALDKSGVASGDGINGIILPSLGESAIFLAARFPKATIVVMAPEQDVFPISFMPVELIDAKTRNDFVNCRDPKIISLPARR